MGDPYVIRQVTHYHGRGVQLVGQLRRDDRGKRYAHVEIVHGGVVIGIANPTMSSFTLAPTTWSETRTRVGRRAVELARQLMDESVEVKDDEPGLVVQPGQVNDDNWREVALMLLQMQATYACRAVRHGRGRALAPGVRKRRRYGLRAHCAHRN